MRLPLCSLALILAVGCEARPRMVVSAESPLVRSNGVRLNGVRLNGVRLNGVRLNGSALAGTLPNGTTVSGSGLVGATLTADLVDGSTATLTIASLRVASNGVTYYVVSTASGGRKSYVCGVDAAGTPTPLLMLDGRWNENEGVAGGGGWIDDPTALTLACSGSALEKCVDMGYAPWQSAREVSLRPYHQACTRLVRADYCGDGRAWTSDGRSVNVYDKLGIQNDTEAWSLEAYWAPQGAACLNVARSKLIIGQGDNTCILGIPYCANGVLPYETPLTSELLEANTAADDEALGSGPRAGEGAAK
jgi:ADYC domain